MLLVSKHPFLPEHEQKELDCNDQQSTTSNSTIKQDRLVVKQVDATVNLKGNAQLQLHL